MKIEIYTRSMNYALYELSQKTVTFPYRKKRCTFTSADGYLYDCIMKSKADVVINIDEDAFITDNNRLTELVKYVVENGFANCGMPDGGVMDIRKHNPLVTNPFFNIINLKLIRDKFNIQEIREHYSRHNPEYEKFAPVSLMKNPYAYDYYEPYNAFFVWLAVNFKTLYLDASLHADGLSTVLKDHIGSPFLYHSWYSRFYGQDQFHTIRIQNLYREATGKEVPRLSLWRRLVSLKDNLGLRYYVPLKRRIEKFR